MIFDWVLLVLLLSVIKFIPNLRISLLPLLAKIENLNCFYFFLANSWRLFHFLSALLLGTLLVKSEQTRGWTSSGGHKRAKRERRERREGTRYCSRSRVWHTHEEKARGRIEIRKLKTKKIVGGTHFHLHLFEWAAAGVYAANSREQHTCTYTCCSCPNLFPTLPSSSRYGGEQKFKKINKQNKKIRKVKNRKKKDKKKKKKRNRWWWLSMALTASIFSR